MSSKRPIRRRRRRSRAMATTTTTTTRATANPALVRRHRRGDVASVTRATPVRRRDAMLMVTTTLTMLTSVDAARAAAAEVTIRRDDEGFGANEASAKALALVSYVGTIVESGEMFDTTYGGEKFDTNSAGVGSQSIEVAPERPVVLNLSSEYPTPGVPEGLRAGVRGMRVGGTREFDVPPELGFGDVAVRSPYATIPAGSTLRYTVKVLRLSTTGPDALFKGVTRCGRGGASAQSSGCGSVEAAE